jgi:hypothetical protein
VHTTGVGINDRPATETFEGLGRRNIIRLRLGLGCRFRCRLGFWSGFRFGRGLFGSGL